MTTDQDQDAVALGIDCMQLVAQGDPRSALTLLRGTDVDHAEIQRAAVAVMAHVLGGDRAAERIDELRCSVLRLAVERGSDDRSVTLNMETVGLVQAVIEGDPDRAGRIVVGSQFAALDISWCAICLAGQVVCGWLAVGQRAGFWQALRRQFGIEAP